MTLPHNWTGGATAYVRWEYRLSEDGAGFCLSVKELEAPASKWRVVCRWREGKLVRWSGGHKAAIKAATMLLADEAEVTRLVRETLGDINRRKRSA
jgi:hypothetical protein